MEHNEGAQAAAHDRIAMRKPQRGVYYKAER